MKKYVRVGDTVLIGKTSAKVVAADRTGRLWITDGDGDSFVVRRRDVTSIK